MQNVSSKWLPAVETNQRVVVRASVLASGQVSRSFYIADNQQAGGKAGSIGSAKITIDATTAQRRSLALSIAGNDSTLVPINLGDLLSPFGNELQLKAGFAYSDGTTELVPMGVFPISESAVEDTGGSLAVLVQGYDRSQTIARRLFKAPYSVTAGTNVATAIKAIISSVAPAWFSYNFAISSYTLPVLTYREGDDPWKASQQLALAAGMQLYFDASGVCTLQPIPAPASTASSWDFTEGAGGTVHSAKRTFTNSGVYNDFFVAGEGTNVSPPVFAEVMDNNPSSPTYVNGPYGDVPQFVREASVSTTAQASASATNLLNKALGLAEQLELKAITNPAQDVYDAITLTRRRMGLSATKYIVSAIHMTLGASNSPMSLTARRVT